jgi:hypothetical protein
MAEAIAQGTSRRAIHSQIRSVGNFPDHRPAHRRLRRHWLPRGLLDSGRPRRLAKLADRPIGKGDRQHRGGDDRTQNTCDGFRRHTRYSSSLRLPTTIIARNRTSSNQPTDSARPCLTEAMTLSVSRNAQQRPSTLAWHSRFWSCLRLLNVPAKTGCACYDTVVRRAPAVVLLPRGAGPMP